MVAQLKEAISEAYSNPNVKALVIRGATGKFSGGADIGSLSNAKLDGPRVDFVRGSTFFNETVEGGPKPVVAAIEGFALGGGLELAMSCHARIAAPKTQLGLPELTLGIIPGFGGTARLPRLVGLAKAVDMMLTSKPIMAEEAVKVGLVDAVVPHRQLLPAARKFALDIVAGKQAWRRTLSLTDRLGSLEDSMKVLQQARARAQKTYRNVPHPFAMLDCIEEGIKNGGVAGTLKEEEVSPKLIASPTAKALMHIFFAQRSAFKIQGITDSGLKPHQMKSVAVIGGGLMGSGIATALVLSNVPVVLKEVNEEFLQAGLKRIEANVKARLARNAPNTEKVQKVLSLVKGTLDYADFADVDMVIE
jgi:enoyl-CoA hydratase/3-hydroxyacyl-CoA dehydrogenase